MKLIKLSANQSSFHTIHFQNGVNIIVGKQSTPRNENDGNTFNGVGKSMIIHLIHYCLGSNKIDSFRNKLKGWSFTLEFELNKKIHKVTGTTEDGNTVVFDGQELSLSKYKSELLLLCFGIETPVKNMTWNTLFSRFARRYRSCYQSFDSFVMKESDYSKLLNNCYLLGIDIQLIVSKKELREKQNNTKNMLNLLKKDEVFKEYFMGNQDAELAVSDIEYRIATLENEIANFEVSKNYHEIEKEANSKSYQKKMLENKRAMIKDSIRFINHSLENRVTMDDNELLDVYKQANVEIPNMIKKNLDEVLSFHKKLISSRNERLKRELAYHETELKDVDEAIKLLGQEMDNLLAYLNTHGALEEYTTLTKQLSDLKNELNKIREYREILNTYQQTVLELRSKFTEEDQQAQQYLNTNEKYLNQLMLQYSSYAKRFYPQKRSGIIVENNYNENLLRYTLNARIEDDSSDGVNEVRIFCFDLLLLTLQKSNMRFLVHDSRLFANMDPRQRDALFRLVNEICLQESLQYICTVNEDTLDSIKHLMSSESYNLLIEENIVLELTDDNAESKLLGIQVDIDLEGKTKSLKDLI